tara:strand:+ start:435 stop:656 length:222 start_codon:yes stop_codon:yes gene_type:complete
MNILDNTAFEQSLMTELEPSPDFEMRRKGRKSGMRQTMLRRVKSRQLKGKIVYGKSGKRLKGTYVKKPVNRRV